MKLVIKMKYIIFAYKAQYRFLFEHYQQLKRFLINVEESDPYLVILKQSYFEDVSYLNDIIFNKLSTRRGYQRKNQVHILNNILTGERMTLEIKNNKIYVESANKNNIFFDIIYQNLKSYVIMEGNL